MKRALIIISCILCILLTLISCGKQQQVSPDEIYGLAAWYDASALDVDDGDAVTTLPDRIMSLGNAVADASDPPVYRKSSDVNSLPGLEFGEDTGLTVTGSAYRQLGDMTVLVVLNADGCGNIIGKRDRGTAGDDAWYLDITDDGGIDFGWKTADGQHTEQPDGDIFRSGETCLVAGVRSGSDGILYINGAQAAYLPNSSESVQNTSSAYIGAIPGICGGVTGTISEIIIFDRALTDEEMNQMSAYLADKWKLDVTIPESGRLRIYSDGEEIRNFSPTQHNYKQALSFDDDHIPTVSAVFRTDSGKEIKADVRQASGIPGTAVITVPGGAEEYTVSFFRAEKPYVHLASPGLTDVVITDGFWLDREGTLSKECLEYSFDRFIEQGALHNFEKVLAGGGTVECFPWQDGLLYEMITAAADYMAQNPDDELKARIDEYIDLIYQTSMSSENGYLSTHAMLEKPGCYFDATGDAVWYHDSYNLGTLIEAGNHYYLATGDMKLLFCAVRYAEFVADNYGYGKINMVPSHELAEEALLDMYITLRDTPGLVEQLEHYSDSYPLSIDIEQYADLVRFWIENRGNGEYRVTADADGGLHSSAYAKSVGAGTYGEYSQDDLYYFDQLHAEGHAVRANLFYTGMAAAGYEFDDPTYLETANNLWQHIVEAQMYITGGVGSSAADEAYAEDFNLPNDGYCESCAQVAMAFFSRYMQNTYAEAKYADVIETQIYNGILGGVGLDGVSFFYQQPLNNPKSSRWGWHDCACCPPMILKLYSRLGTYIYSFSDDSVYINQFISSDASLDNGVSISMVSDMPYSGSTSVTVGGKDTRLMIRIPAWADADAIAISRNGELVSFSVTDGYAAIDAKCGDVIGIDIPLEAQRVYADERVACDIGRVALRYGALIYCVEGIDNPSADISAGEDSFTLPKDSELTLCSADGLPEDTVAIEFDAVYGGKPCRMKAIPFWLRANRGESASYVWLKEE